MKQGLRINGADLGRKYTLTPDLGRGGVAFYEGRQSSPEITEQRVFYDAILNNKPLTVLPEQALVVTQILEAIYDSAKAGKAIQF
jgi:predicted dehydrogenase